MKVEVDVLGSRPYGQLRGDKECPFSGVTKSGRVWRKVPESDARSVPRTATSTLTQHLNYEDAAGPAHKF